MTQGQDALIDRIGDLIRNRRATRAFRGGEVPADTLRAVFELANHAPSNSNTQPWLVEVVNGATKDRLAEALVTAHDAGHLSPDFPYREDLYQGDLKDRRSQFGAQLYETLGVGRNDTEMLEVYNKKSLQFYGAPHVAMIFAPNGAEARIATDIGIYTQTLLLAMTAHGIASCPQGLLSFYADTVRAVLGIKNGRLLLGVSFGYADDTAAINTVHAPRENLSITTRFHQ
jgi:nitroreductase